MKKSWILWLILLAAAGLRLYHLASISLWHDEAFSALLINYPWKEMFYRIGLDVHPPVYYIFLRFWADVFGHSLFALRAFSAFFGVLTVWGVYLFVKEAFNREGTALLAAALIAVNPFQIQYVTEARMYTLGAFLTIISAYFLVKAIKEHSRWNWLWFAVATSLGIYTHYYVFFSAAAIGLFGLIYMYQRYTFKSKNWLWFIGAYVLVFLSYLPWLKTFLFQFKQVQANYWIPAMNKWSIPLTLYEMLTGAGADAAKTSTEVVLVLVLLFSLWMLWRIYKQHTVEKWMVILGVIVPFAGAILLSIKQSIFLDRYFLFAALFYTIALALWLNQLGIRLFRNILVAFIVFLCVFNWAKNWHEIDSTNQGGMSAAADYLNAVVLPDDKLYVDSSFEFFNFKYYNQTGHRPLLYTGGNAVAQLPHFSGTALLTDNDLVLDFNRGVKRGDVIWVLYTNAFGHGDNVNVPSNWILEDQHKWQDVRPYFGTQIIVDKFVVGGKFVAVK